MPAECLDADAAGVVWERLMERKGTAMKADRPGSDVLAEWRRARDGGVCPIGMATAAK